MNAGGAPKFLNPTAVAVLIIAPPDLKTPSNHLRGHTQMPAQLPLQGMKERFGDPAKIPFPYITVLDVVSDAIWENVLDLYPLHAEAMSFHKLPEFAAAVGIGDRAASLRLGIARD